MKSAAKRKCRKSQREAARVKRQGDPEPIAEDEDPEITFRPVMDLPGSTSSPPPLSPTSPGELDYGVVLDMVQKINGQLETLNLDADNIRSICDGLLRDYKERDLAIGNLVDLGPSSAPSTSYRRSHAAPHYSAGPHR